MIKRLLMVIDVKHRVLLLEGSVVNRSESGKSSTLWRWSASGSLP